MLECIDNDVLAVKAFTEFNRINRPGTPLSVRWVPHRTYADGRAFLLRAEGHSLVWGPAFWGRPDLAGDPQCDDRAPEVVQRGLIAATSFSFSLPGRPPAAAWERQRYTASM